MKYRSISRGIALSFVCALTGCLAAQRTVEAPTLTLGVSPAMETLARGLIEAYALAYPQETPFQIAVSSAAMIRSDLYQGRISAAVQWNPPASDDWSAAIGWTGIVVIVNPQNSVGNLSRGQVRDIFLGLIDRWEDVGGPAGDIHRLDYEPEQDITSLFQEIVLESDRTASGFQTVPAPYALLEEIRKDPLSIGYLPGFDFSREVRPITVDHVTAEYANLIPEKYPFRVPVYLISKDPVPAVVVRFAGWAQSVQGQSVFLAMHSWE
jgi:ABC-type phosphate transport system substrate-binding protein